jgi:uncharacterized membrane protein
VISGIGKKLPPRKSNYKKHHEGVMAEEMIVAVFPSRVILTKALDYLMELESVKIIHAVIIAKAKDGEIVVLDDEISTDEGAIAGGTLGAAMTAFSLIQLGALTLPGVGPIIALGTGLLAGGLVGGFAGRFAASMIDFEYKNKQVKALANRLQSGHPALVLQVENPQDTIETLRKSLTPFRAEMVEFLHEAQYIVNKASRG